MPQVAPYLGPLDKELIKEMLRMMRNNAFQASHLLLAAIASCNPRTMQIHGLIAVRPCCSPLPTLGQTHKT